MAKAREDRQVTVTLTLDETEARALAEVLGRIGGISHMRTAACRVGSALRDVGYDHTTIANGGNDILVGHLRFQDELLSDPWHGPLANWERELLGADDWANRPDSDEPPF